MTNQTDIVQAGKATDEFLISLVADLMKCEYSHSQVAAKEIMSVFHELFTDKKD